MKTSYIATTASAAIAVAVAISLLYISDAPDQAQTIEGSGLGDKNEMHAANVKNMSSYDCEMMQVMSPEHDWGCVTVLTARLLENSGWTLLDEYPKDFNYLGPEWEHISNLTHVRSWPPDRHPVDGLKIELRMPELPLVGQSADVILDVASPHNASPVNAAFEFRFIGDVEILSTYPLLEPNKFLNDHFPGKNFATSRIEILPGETRQFIVTIMPKNETPLTAWADGFDEHGNFATQSGGSIRISIGNRSSDYQLDEDSYTKNPFTKYVWTEIPHPQWGGSPWGRNGQSVYDYYEDRGIEIHDIERVPAFGWVCDASDCFGGTIMFLTPEYDRADVLAINFWEPYGTDPPF